MVYSGNSTEIKLKVKVVSSAYRDGVHFNDLTGVFCQGIVPAACLKGLIIHLNEGNVVPMSKLQHHYSLEL